MYLNYSDQDDTVWQNLSTFPSLQTVQNLRCMSCVVQSDLIGKWKCNFPALLKIMPDQPTTDGPTNRRPTEDSQGIFTLNKEHYVNYRVSHISCRSAVISCIPERARNIKFIYVKDWWGVPAKKGKFYNSWDRTQAEGRQGIWKLLLSFLKQLWLWNFSHLWLIAYILCPL